MILSAKRKAKGMVTRHCSVEVVKKDLVNSERRRIQREEHLLKKSAINQLLKKLHAEKKILEHKHHIRQKEQEETVRKEIMLEKKKIEDQIKDQINEIRSKFKQKHKMLRNQYHRHLPTCKISPSYNRLYYKWQKVYEDKVNFDKKQKLIAMKCKIPKRTSTEELLEHGRKHRLIMEDNTRRRKMRQEIFMQESRLRKEQQERLFVSRLRLIETDKNDDPKKEEKRHIRKKMQDYVEIIQQMNPVVVDKDKVEELKKRIEHLKPPIRKPKDIKEIKEMYNISNIMKSTNYKRVAFSKNAYGTHNSSCDTKRKIDYLTNMRQQHEDYLKTKQLKFNWKEDFNNNDLEREERNERIMKKAENAEKLINIKAKLLYNRSEPSDNVELNESLFNVLSDSIKAKLAILSNQ